MKQEFLLQCGEWLVGRWRDQDILHFHRNVLIQGCDNILVLGALGRDSPRGELWLDMCEPYQGGSTVQKGGSFNETAAICTFSSPSLGDALGSAILYFGRKRTQDVFWRANLQLFTTFHENTKIGWLWLTFVVATQYIVHCSIQFSSVQFRVTIVGMLVPRKWETGYSPRKLESGQAGRLARSPHLGYLQWWHDRWIVSITEIRNESRKVHVWQCRLDMLTLSKRTVVYTASCRRVLKTMYFVSLLNAHIIQDGDFPGSFPVNQRKPKRGGSS